MALPNVSIIVGDGALGRTTATADGVAGMVLTGVAAAGLALDTPSVIYSLSEAVAKGITSATHPHAYGQIADFYDQAGTGATLWIILVANTTTHANVFTADTGPMDKLLIASQGAITIAAISMGRISGYTPSMTGLVDYNLPTVAAAAQARATAAEARFAPVFILLDGTYLLNPLTSVTSIKGAGDRVGVFLGASASGDKKAAIGRFLGRLAGDPVHQSIARVKTGPFLAEAYLTSGLALTTYTEGHIASLHDAGYIALRTFPGVFGAFATDDVTLAQPASDFSSITRRRVMDKAIRIAYAAYVYELHESIEILSDGRIEPTKATDIESTIGRALEQRMLQEGNISTYEVSVDPRQNVFATDKIEVVVKIVPLGYLKEIVVRLGFSNPSA